MFTIGGIQKTTLIDFPQKIAAIVFTQGCNFRCGYCHNPELLDFNSKQNYDVEDFFEFLKTRQNKLDGVVITGGEPTMQSGLCDFIQRIKSLGFEVKLDTNGTNPDVLSKLLKDNLVDYIAMDIKSPFAKYCNITNTNVDLDKIKESIHLLINNSIDYEFRTTVVKQQLGLDDFIEIGEMIKGAKKYYLQKFVPSKIYDYKLKNFTTYSDDELKVICEHLKKYIKHVDYR